MTFRSSQGTKLFKSHRSNRRLPLIGSPKIRAAF
jgi:hypothetical protein